MSLVSRKAPAFTAAALVDGQKMVNDFSLAQYEGEKYVVLFFYPKDFSGICPTEFWAFQERLSDFEQRGAVVVGCSGDTDAAHLAWVNTPRAKNGIEGITFPLVADMAKTIAFNYGVLGGDFAYEDDGRMSFDGAPIALRGTFIINKKGIVMYESINFFTVARDMDIILRELDAVQHFEQAGEVCLANWKKK